MKKIKLRICWMVALLAILFNACNDEQSDIGLGFLGNSVGTDFTDTVSVEAYSLLEDTLNTTNLSANILGQLHDPVFGDNTASIYSQFTLTGSSVNFGTDPVIDSVVLTLQLSSYYGDTTSKVAIRVHQLTGDLSKDTKYYQNSTAPYDNTVLNYSQTSYAIHPTQEVIVDTNAYSPHLRIRLADNFGQYLLNHQGEMTSQSSFTSFFKGLYLTALSHTGATGYMLITNMNSSLSGIVLYYHNSSGGGKKYTFPCSKDCVRFTNFSHNYEASSHSGFTQQVLCGNRDLGRQQLYVQATGGVKTRITFPHLKETFNAIGDRVVINRAELVIADVSPDEAHLLHPTALSLQGIRLSDNAIAYLPDDDYYTSSSYFGGTYDAAKHEYRFRITAYVQGVISGNSTLSNTMNLVVKGAGVRANRLVLGGTGLPDDKRLRLELSYTTY